MIDGYDISSWDDDPNTPAHVNFDILSKSTRFCIARAGYGGWVDRDFLRSWSEMRRLNMIRGAYWYVTDQVAPRAAAQAFVTAMGTDYGTIRPCADFEPAFWTDNKPKVAVLREFVEEVYRLTGKRCMIYTGYYVWRDYGSADAYWLQYPLWIANYNNVPAPLVPAPWKSWKFWQFTDRAPGGPAIGIESDMIDNNHYYGTEAQFTAEFGNVTLPPALEKVVTSVVNIDGPIEQLIVVNFADGTSQTIDQRPIVPPVVSTPGLYRILDDIERGCPPRPVDSRTGKMRDGLPSTVRMKGGAGSTRLTPAWMEYSYNIQGNPNFQFASRATLKDAIGWHNQGEPNRVEQVVFSGNVVEVTRIEGTRAYIKTVCVTDAPPSVLVKPTTGRHPLIHNFSIQYTDHLDITTDGKWARTIVMSNPGEQLYIELAELAKL